MNLHQLCRQWSPYKAVEEVDLTHFDDDDDDFNLVGKMQKKSSSSSRVVQVPQFHQTPNSLKSSSVSSLSANVVPESKENQSGNAASKTPGSSSKEATETPASSSTGGKKRPSSDVTSSEKKKKRSNIQDFILGKTGQTSGRNLRSRGKKKSK